MFEKRTDLALEVREMHGEDSGIEVSKTEKNNILITTAIVKQGEGEKASGKSAGKYITFDVGEIWRFDKTRFELTAKTIAEELAFLVPQGEGAVLVVGLGNESITPDSVGPRAVKKLVVTRHIETIDPLLYKSAGFGKVAAIAPGVLGQTGIESAEIIKSVCQSIRPKCVIIIDSLASRRLSRLATTVQLSDSGISPGSGVSNRRVELNSKTLGTSVVSIGVPTVVDAATLAYDLLEESMEASDDRLSEIIEKVLSGNGKNMFVTPKDNDVIAAETAKLLAAAINMAVHSMSLAEIQEYI